MFRSDRITGGSEQVAAKFGLRYIYKCRQVKTPITSVSNEVWNSSGLSD